MYEISLVPDVKAELLQKQKMRNLIIFICIIVACVCVGIILIMLSIMGAQSLSIKGQENEIACRADGIPSKGDKCNNFGQPVMTFKNVNELLTIQDQMNSIGTLNSNRVKFSRVFGILDVILPDGRANGDVVSINELSADISKNMISFDAIGESKEINIGFHVLETFRKGVNRTYFDYGNYMRKNSDGEYEVIPSFCIKEYTEKGYTYGKYMKGEPGCEAPMVVSDTTEVPSDEEGNQSSDEDAEEEDSKEEKKKEETEVKKEVIVIRRTYDSSEDLENYKNGNDSKKKEGDTKESVTGYYFQSECFKYKEDGSFDENETLATCPLLTDNGLSVGQPSYGRGKDDKMVLSFSANLSLDPRVFKSGSKHMQIFGPSRQNVTDSYVEVRDMFTAKAKATSEEEE